MATWVILSASLTVFFVLEAVFLYRRHRTARRDELFKDRLAIERTTPGLEANLLKTEPRGRAAFLDDLLRETGTHQRLQDILDQAGDRATPGELLLRCALWGLGPAIVFGTLLMSPAIALIGAGLGVVPLLLLLHRRSRRMAKIDAQLPVALEIMTISLRAGHSLAQTIALSARELQAPLRDELVRCAEEQELGRPLEEVLVQLTHRLPRCRAVRTFVVAVLVLQQTGGNLIEIIERIIETLRMQNQYERKLAAMTAEGKSSARMLSGLPAAFMALAYVADPSYIGILFTHPLGRKLLVAAVILWLLGVLWTRKLISPAAQG